MKLILTLLVVLFSSNMAHAKLSCVDGVLIQKNKTLSTEEAAALKTKVETKLANVSKVKEDAKDPEKRAEKKAKLTTKLELINSCGN